MTSPVVDLSHHNPTPRWDELLDGGVYGVIHKATEGTSYVDDTLFERARAAMDAGLKWSTYHFLRASSPLAQIDHYLNTIKPVQGERVCLDHEDSSFTLINLENAVQYLHDIRPDLQICIYSGHLIKEQLGDRHSPILAKTSLWIAHYTSASAPSWPKGTWPTWSLWQYTDSETVPGISAPVDGDRWNGTTEALLEWFGPAGEQPAPAPEPEPEAKVVNVQITATEGVTVLVTINGETVT